MNLGVEFSENEEKFGVRFNGAQVINGKDGKDGFSPIVTTEETDDGVKVTITDANGTSVTTVKHGRDGKDGDKGDPGKDGEDGHTPVNGVDYFTPEEKAAFVKEVEKGAIGDIDAALDAIIALQNSLIGGDSV